ncbi:MAG TPA: phosphoribosylanthranilate isomerase [Candidatus Nanoarchaeia archaeon]|nr:phosphoribosylanthranilate isomerase [Candidatus Nanoarchaeia archaeon]
MKVKICGITNLQDAVSAMLVGADYIGFLVEVRSAKDRIKREEAKEIIAKLPPEVKPVYVTTEKKAKKIIEIARDVKPALIQLHGDIPITEIQKIRKALKKTELIKSITIKNLHALDIAKEYEPSVDYLLLDSSKDKVRQKGEVHDWEISRHIVAASKKPVFLAGGLTPKNVSDAIGRVKPFGVDVNSGVETRSRQKNHQLMKLFIQNVHSWRKKA